MNTWFGLCSVAVLTLATTAGQAAPRRVLILSGANNHDWRATTPVLREILGSTGRWAVEVSTNVAALTPASFAPYDVILSNFNTFGQKDPGAVWNAEVRAAFLDHIRKGKGFVAVHAGSSVFYDWPEFQQLAGTSWGQRTGHGQPHTNEVHLAAAQPIVTGLADFATFDEFWQTTELAPGTEVLATVAPKEEFGGTGRPEPIALATRLGAGRGFTLLLGHDVRAMNNPGFKRLLLRGVAWAATGAAEPEADAGPRNVEKH